MDKIERKNIVQSWLAAHRNMWAYHLVDELIKEKSEEAWPIIIELLGNAESNDEIGLIGAGPLEDFVIAHGDKYIVEIEKLFHKDNNFKLALLSIWVPVEDKPIYKKLISLGCDKIRNNR